MQFLAVVLRREDDLWTALRYTLAVIGGIVMVFTVPKAIWHFSSDPLMAIVVLAAAVGWCVSVRHIR